MNYLQKKKQAIIMMLAAQIVKSAQGYPVTISDSKSGAAVDYTVYGNTVTENGSESYVGDKTDNLIDENTVLTAQGWVKQADGSYYVENNRDVYHKKIWENTEGYTGRLRVSYRFKYKQSKAEAGSAGSYLQIVYTDGTTFNVWLSNPKWDADTWLLPNENYTLTNASKTVDYIGWSYGTGMNSTWVKNIFVSKNTAVTQYEPCGYKIQIVNSGSDSAERSPVTVNTYLKAPLKKGESINFRSDGLPKLTLFEGENIITASTAIKPEKISVDYYEK